MTEYNILGQSIGGKKKGKNKEQNIFGSGLDFGLTLPKKQKNPLNVGFGFGPLPKKEIERDSRRNFTITQQKELKKSGKCKHCGTKLSDDNIDYDHIKPWEDGGKTILANGQALCLKCHRKKTRKEKLKKIDKKRKPKNGNKNILGGNVFGPPPKRSKNNPFGF